MSRLTGLKAPPYALLFPVGAWNPNDVDGCKIDEVSVLGRGGDIHHDALIGALYGAPENAAPPCQRPPPYPPHIWIGYEGFWGV
jgi:hypothetical protein